MNLNCSKYLDRNQWNRNRPSNLRSSIFSENFQMQNKINTILLFRYTEFRIKCNIILDLTTQNFYVSELGFQDFSKRKNW